MRCVEMVRAGGPEVLELAERPSPTPGEGEILIRLAYAGVNRPDVLQRSGSYPPPPGASDLLGLEGAGVVEAVGEGAERWSAGDRVTALLPGGGYAEMAVTRWNHVLPVPGPLGMAEASALPETFFTVWANVFDRCWLKPEEWLLVHGGASGIGTTAIQLASALGSRVIATAGSDEKCARCLELGASRAVNYREEDFVAAAKEATGGHGADVILDMVGGGYMARNVRAAAVEGRIASIAFLEGSKVELDFAPAMVKRLTWRGSTLRARPDGDKAALARVLEEWVWPLLEEGRIAPVMDSAFPLERAADAHRRMESSQHIGKIVLETGN